MTLSDFNDLGKYISNKTNKETIFKPDIREIKNEDFKYIKLIGDTCCIRYREDSRKEPIQYKTLNGAKSYVDRCLRGDFSEK